MVSTAVQPGDDLNPAVAGFLGQGPLSHSIGGQHRASASRRTGEVINPSDGRVVATVALGGADEIDAAVCAADKAFKVWAATAPSERAVLLHRLADIIEAEADNLAQLEAIDVGKPVADAAGFDIPFAIEGFRYFADLSTGTQYDIPLAIKNIEARTHLTPYGVCGFVFPWNFPFMLLAWGVAPALAAGNSVVVKPSEVTPLTTLYFCQLVEQIGFPEGLVNVVNGTGAEAGAALPEHPLVRRMSFTGSPGVGRLVGEACGRRPIPAKLELGGKGAAVVFDDVDVAATAETLAAAITLNTGQVCCTATRWIVQDRIHDELVARVSQALGAVHVGPALDPASTMGPVVSQTQLDRVTGYIDRGQSEGATLVFQGGAAASAGGYYVSPALLAGSEDNVCFREEIFGPVAYITRFSDERQAVKSVNSLTYGLANSVWSADLDRANRVGEQLVAGNSWINAHNVFAYGLPYGGVNLSGTGGGVNSPETFADYLRPQTIARPL